MASVFPMIILLLVCCCCLVAAGGGYYLWTNSQTDSNTYSDTNVMTSDTSAAPTITNPLPEVVKKVTAAECQSVSAIDKTALTGCTDGATESGFTWNWGADPVSQACKANTAYYEVTAVSSYLPNLKLKQTIKGADQMTAGIKGMLSDWHQANVTFTVMPKDKNKKNLMLYPVSIPITQATDNQSCATAGVNAVRGVPRWNEYKNIIDVGVKSTYGAAAGIAVIDESGHEEFFSGYGGGINWSERAIVPKGYSVQSWCQDTGNLSCNRVKTHTWDDMNKAQKSGMLEYVGTCLSNCPTSGL